MPTITWDDSEEQSSPKITWDVQPDSAGKRFMRGLKDPLDAAAQMLYNALPDGVTSTVDQANNKLAELGIVARMPEGGMNEYISAQEVNYNAPEGVDWARLGGNIAGGVALTRGLPVKPTFGGRMAVNTAAGAGLGALTPVVENQDNFWEEKAKQGGTGAAFGAAATPIGEGISRVVLPKAATNPDLAKLREANVTPTVGQAGGGWLNRMEEKLQSVPVIGDAITSARSNAAEQYRLATLNKVLEPLGKTATKVGQEGVDEVHNIISQSYDDALIGLKGIKLDGKGLTEFNNLRQMSQYMPEAKSFNKFINERVINRMTKAKGMHAETFKIIESDLTKKISQVADNELKNAYKEALSILRDTAARQNPQYADALARTNKAYAMLKTIENASKKAALNEGNYTPGQLLQSVREADRSAGKNMTARGKAMLQDWATSGQNVLANRFPNSGTTDRALLLGTGAAGYVDPVTTAAMLGAGAGLYTSPMQRLGLAAMTQRPELSKPIAELIRQSTPGATLPLTGLLYSK